MIPPPLLRFNLNFQTLPETIPDKLAMNAYAFVKRILSFSRANERFELFGIGADRLEFGQHLCDIALSQIPVVIMSAPTDGDVCKVRRDHDSNLDAITRFASEML